MSEIEKHAMCIKLLETIALYKRHINNCFHSSMMAGKYCKFVIIEKNNHKVKIYEMVIERLKQRYSNIIKSLNI